MVEATVHIGNSTSHCGACGRPCDPMAASHDRLLGYGPDNGQPGCGAMFTATFSVYGDRASVDATIRMRPDLPNLNGDIGILGEW